MEHLPEDKAQALREEVKNWAGAVFEKSQQYQNACWWIASAQDREILLGLLRQMSADASLIRDILIEN
jgi:hypothetical protein